MNGKAGKRAGLVERGENLRGAPHFDQIAAIQLLVLQFSSEATAVPASGARDLLLLYKDKNLKLPLLLTSPGLLLMRPIIWRP
jgi:hypothetical protein